MLYIVVWWLERDALRWNGVAGGGAAAAAAAVLVHTQNVVCAVVAAAVGSRRGSPRVQHKKYKSATLLLCSI